MYICPMHPEVKQNKPERCPKCGMDLVEAKSHKSMDHQTVETKNASYAPLLVIVGLIFVTALAISYPLFNVKTIIETFMIGFFLVFSGFKLIDLKGFAQGYSTYDLLAKRVFSYGYVYPFVELFFGISMILSLYSRQILWAELIVMSFSGLGVAIKLVRHERFQCACLGTFLKVPLTYVTLVEDFGMAALAALLLLWI